MPGETASPWNHLMIPALCEPPRWKTHFCHNFLQMGGRGRWGTLTWHRVLFLHRPRGAKARQGTGRRRERGYAECSNRWDESSVPVRYALSRSYRATFSFSTALPLLRALQFFHSSYFAVFQFTRSPHLSASFVCLFPLAPLFLSLPPFTSLPPFCLVFDMLPKTTSTLHFPLLTLECKMQRGRGSSGEGEKKTLTVTFLHAEKWAAFPLSSVFLTAATKYWPNVMIVFH